MASSRHTWTMGQVKFAALLWRENRSCNHIADAMMSVYGVALSSNSIISLARRHRELMPIRSAEQLAETYARIAQLRRKRAA